MNEITTDKKAINDFIEISHRLRERGLTTGGGGGISIFLPDTSNILVKGWEIASEDLREEDIALMDLSGKQISDMRPCLEAPLHLAVIKARKGIGAVIHAHAPYTTAFGNIKQQLSDDLLMNNYMLRKAVFTPYAKPGSVELSNIVAKPFEKEDVICVLMQDHGVTVVGDDIYDAYYKLDMIEGYATAFCHTVLLKSVLNPAG